MMGVWANKIICLHAALERFFRSSIVSPWIILDFSVESPNRHPSIDGTQLAGRWRPHLFCSRRSDCLSWVPGEAVRIHSNAGVCIHYFRILPGAQTQSNPKPCVKNRPKIATHKHINDGTGIWTVSSGCSITKDSSIFTKRFVNRFTVPSVARWQR